MEDQISRRDLPGPDVGGTKLPQTLPACSQSRPPVHSGRGKQPSVGHSPPSVALDEHKPSPFRHGAHPPHEAGSRRRAIRNLLLILLPPSATRQGQHQDERKPLHRPKTIPDGPFLQALEPFPPAPSPGTATADHGFRWNPASLPNGELIVLFFLAHPAPSRGYIAAKNPMFRRNPPSAEAAIREDHRTPKTRPSPGDSIRSLRYQTHGPFHP